MTAGVWYAEDPVCQHWPLSYLSGVPEQAPSAECTIGGISWSEDGKNLLSASRGEVSSELRLALHFLDGQGTSMPIAATDDTVSAATLAPDGRHIVIGSVQGRLWWFDTDSAEAPPLLVELPARRGFFTAVAIAPDGRLVAGGTDDGTVHLCDPDRRSSVRLTAPTQSSFGSLRFAGDGKRLVGSQGNGRIVLWDLNSQERVQDFAGHEGPATVADILPDGNRIISVGLEDNSVRIWDIASGRELWRGEFGLNGVRALAVSPDGRTAAWGGYHNRIIVWDLDRQRKKFEIATTATSIYHLRFSPHGTALAAGGTGEFIRLYDPRTGAEIKSVEVARPLGGRRAGV